MVRFVDIDAQVSDLNGIYEDLHKCKSGADLSNLLKENCGKYHGIAAEEFVKRLAADDEAQDTVKSAYDQTKNEFIEKFGLSEADPVVIRVAETIALYITTGILASSDYCGIFTHNVVGIEEAIYAIFDRWLADRGGRKSVEDHAIIEHVIGFLMQHESRFKKTRDLEERTIINCLGYKDMTTDATIFYIIPKLFREEMCRGMNIKMIRKILKKACILEIDADGQNPKCPVYVHERRLRLITLIVNNSSTNER